MTINFIVMLFIIKIIFTKSNIISLSQLNSKINQGPMRKIGFLSEGNYHTVQNELSPLVEPVYFKDKDKLNKQVENENILAGLVSGTPKNSFNIFGSDQISIRSMLVAHNNVKLLDAIDAAIVRIIERGDVEKIAKKNSPYQALVVHSCKPSSNHFDWPELKNNTIIKIAALGPYHWGGTDGDYTKKPFIGFWPDYYKLIEDEFVKQYNITFKRIWYKTSKEVLNSVKSGQTNTTEPYMMVGASYQDQSRKSAFSLSCITSATQDKYFTKKKNLERNNKVSSDQSISIYLAITFAALLLVSGIFIYIMYSKEKKGIPLFQKKLLSPVDPSSIIQNNHL